MVKKQKTKKTKNKEEKLIKISNISNTYYYNSKQNEITKNENESFIKMEEKLKELKSNYNNMANEYYTLLIENQTRENIKMKKHRDKMKKIVEKNKKKDEKAEKNKIKNKKAENEKNKTTEKTKEKDKDKEKEEKKENKDNHSITESVSDNDASSSDSIEKKKKENEKEDKNDRSMTESVSGDNASSSSSSSSNNTEDAKKNQKFYKVFAKTYEKYENFEKYNKKFDNYISTTKEPCIFRPDAARIQFEVEELIKKIEKKKSEKNLKEPKECPYCGKKRDRKALNEHIYLKHEGKGLKPSVLETMYKKMTKKRYKRIREILNDIIKQKKICGVKDTCPDDILEILNKQNK